MTDILSSIISTFIERAAVTPEIALEIEKHIRQQWGGGQAYIAKHCALNSKKQTINNALRAGHSITQIVQLHGIPRRTIYRLIDRNQE